MPPQTVKHRFTTFPTLADERVVLRRITSADAAGLQAICVYDGVAATSERDALSMLIRIELDYQDGDTVHWGICLPGTTEVVGTCGFYRGYPDNTGEIGYVLKEAYRGQGIMTAALRLVITFGFDHLKLNRIVAYTNPTNAPSIAVLTRLGFQPVSVEPQTLSFALDAPQQVTHDDGTE